MATRLRDYVRAYLFHWFQPETRQSTRAHILRGFSKCFLLYFVPMCLIRRGNIYRNFRRAAALGVFVAGVRAADDILTKLKEAFDHDTSKKPKTAAELFVTKYTLGVAAFVSALIAINVDGEIQESITVVLWTLVRAVRPFVPHIPGGSTILMCLTSAILLDTWITHPENHNPGYRKFLDIHGGKDKETLQALRYNFSCNTSHPGISCWGHFFKFWITSLPRSLKLYAPVYITTFLLSSTKNIPRTIIGYLRSTVFLSSYCTLAWASLCMANKLRSKGMKLNNIFHHGWISGLAVLLEPKGRRGELAAYCLTYALETVFIYLQRRGYVNVSPSVNSLMLAVAAGILVHHHEQQPKAMIHWLFKLGSGNVRVFP